MSPRPAGRTQECDRSQAAVRLAHARAFLETAELVGDADDELATPQVATALAVLAGIAASDAICCAALGRRSRGQDHRQAIDLVQQVAPDGPVLSRDLARLLDLKDGAHYGMVYVTGAKAITAVRHARRLTDAASSRLSR